MNVSTERLEASAGTEPGARSHAQPLPGIVTEEERTLLGIRQARDLVLGKNRELIDKLAQAEDQIAELTFQRDDFMVARDVALKKAAVLEAEVVHLREQVSLLTEQQAALGEAEKIYVLARTEIEADLLALAEERDAAVSARRADAVEIERLRTELAAAQTTPELSGPGAAELKEAMRQLAVARDDHERFAAQQKKYIAVLADQLSTATCAVQEGRRHVERLEAEKKRLADEKAELEAALAANPSAGTLPPHADGRSPVAPLSGPPPPKISKPAPTPVSDQEMRDTIGSLIVQFETLKEQPVSLKALGAFEGGLHAFGDRTRDSGLDLIHHIVSTAGDYASRLHMTPGKIAASLPTFDRALEMLGWLGLRGRAEMLDATGALVYAVDDDLDNCECIATALEKVALQTKYAVRPEIALEQIAANAFELIILDVDLPGMDGFELHSHLRKMPAHAATPIIFLSGHLSTIERLEALGEDNNEFVAKPYNLSELSLRVLSRIVEARLG
ncbi:MAG: response regulator [Chthoniobacteraceae bacterium]